MHFHIGYFENFNGADTTLLCGDEESLQRLANLLRPLEDPNAEPVNLNLLPFVQVHGSVELTAYPVDRELGIRRTGSGLCFSWHHSQDGWLESADKIEAVAQRSGGHYDFAATPAGDAVAVVSKGEYDEAWWERHGYSVLRSGGG